MQSSASTRISSNEKQVFRCWVEAQGYVFVDARRVPEKQEYEVFVANNQKLLTLCCSLATAMTGVS